MAPGVACFMQTFLLHTAHSSFTFRSALRGLMWQRRIPEDSLLLRLQSMLRQACPYCPLGRSLGIVVEYDIRLVIIACCCFVMMHRRQQDDSPCLLWNI